MRDRVGEIVLYVFLVVIFGFIAVGIFYTCKSEPPRVVYEKDGCKVTRIKDGGKYVYFTDCRGKVEWDENEGKTTRRMAVETVR